MTSDNFNDKNVFVYTVFNLETMRKKMWKSEIAVREVKSDIRSNDKVENI